MTSVPLVSTTTTSAPLVSMVQGHWRVARDNRWLSDAVADEFVAGVEFAVAAAAAVEDGADDDGDAMLNSKSMLPLLLASS